MSERIDRGVVAMDDGKVRVDDEIFDQVILATGMSAAPGQTELYKQIEAELGLRMVDRYPLLDDKLSWLDGEDLYGAFDAQGVITCNVGYVYCGLRVISITRYV